jgi:hypothetical protein
MLHGLMDVLKNARSMRTEVQPFWAYCSSSSAVSTAEAYTKFLNVRKGKIKGMKVWWMTWPGYWSPPSSPLSSAGSLKVVYSGIPEVGWGTIVHERHFFKYPVGQYPITLARCAPKYVGKLSLWGKTYGPTKQSWTVPAHTLIGTSVDVWTELYYVGLCHPICACYGNLICHSLWNLLH